MILFKKWDKHNVKSYIFKIYMFSYNKQLRKI